MIVPKIDADANHADTGRANAQTVDRPEADRRPTTAASRPWIDAGEFFRKET